MCAAVALETAEVAEVTTIADDLTTEDVARYERVYAACAPQVRGEAQRGLASLPPQLQAAVSADDLAQEVWLRLWRAWPRLAISAHDDRMVYAYALRAARHLVIDVARGRELRWRVGERPLSEDGWQMACRALPSVARDEQPEAAALDRETLAEALAVVRALPTAQHISPAQQEALLAGILAEESQEQIAARLGVTVGAVKMRKWRVREELRVWVAEGRMVEALP